MRRDCFASLAMTGMTVLVAATVAGCKAPVTAVRAPVPIRVKKLGGPGEAGGTRFSATIKPDTQVELAFKSGGYVDALLQIDGRAVQEGDVVKKGAVLARVREKDYQDKVAEAQAAAVKAKGDFQRAAQLYETGSVSKADYDAAFAQMSASKARYQQAATALSDARLVAPMDGTILKRTIEVGTLAAPGVTAFSIANTKSAKVVFGVTDTMVGKMKVGAPQVVTTSALPDEEFKGVISRVAASADPSSRDFDVEVTIPNPNGMLRVGMIASLKLDLPQTAPTAASPGLRVPIQAVVRPKGEPKGYGVYVIEDKDGKTFARIRKVVPGDVFGNEVAVSEGVKEGDQLIVTGSTFVQDGDEVRVVP